MSRSFSAQHRKRLRQANNTLQSRVRVVVDGEVRDAGRLLSRSHDGLCKATAAFQDICRNIKVANEELTECSVEMMDAMKRMPPFLSAGQVSALDSKDGFIIVNQWETLAGGPVYHNYKDGLYGQYLALKKSKPSEQILRDLPRTPGLALLDHSRGKDMLKNVLHAYSLHDPQCGYVQGMAMVCAFILSKFSAHPDKDDNAGADGGAGRKEVHRLGSSDDEATDDNKEERAFWIFSQIMTAPKYNMRRFFLPGMPHMHIACYQLESLLVQRLSRVAKHFDSLNIRCNDFLSRWLLPIFTSSFLPATLLDGIWTRYLERGYPALISAALGSLVCCEQIILLQDHDACQEFLVETIWSAVPEPTAIFAAASRPSRVEIRDLDQLELAFQSSSAK